MDTNDDFRKNIDDIKSDISMIKNSIATLSSEFNTHIQEHSVTSNNPANTAVLVHDIKTDISIENNVNINDNDNLQNSLESASDKFNLIDYSFIKNNDDNKSLIQVLLASSKNINSLYKKRFLEFCRCAIGLVEEVIQIFLEKKFIAIDNEENNNLLKACDLLENKYQNINWKFPNIFLTKQQYNYHKLNPAHYYYISKKESYLSLINLRKADIIFTLELCFIILYGEKFDIKSYQTSHNVNSLTSSKALQKPTPRLAFAVEPLRKEFYFLIDAARKFRNIIVHNKTNKERQQNELQELRKNRYIKENNVENNYDGILEAVNWFIRQMYIDMTKN